MTNISRRILIFSDGGARGNPGPAAIAFLALSENGQSLMQHSDYLGCRTNNQAEYEALIAGLRFALDKCVDEVVCYLDSQLVTKQLNGEYAVKNFELNRLWMKVQDLKKGFKKISFISLPRSNPHIETVDRLLNERLDRELKSRCN